MPTYIEKFNSTIKQRQTEQILKLLNKQKSTGQIRTVEEFTTKLDNLVRQLTQVNIVPTLKLFPAEKKDVIDSDTFNHQLDRVEDDLTTAFSEAFNIDQVQRAHEAIIRDVILKNLKHGIAELESKVSLYEFLNGDPNGFNASIFSTFREAREERTSRGDKQTATLFKDPRTDLATAANKEDANIDLVGERLILGFSTKGQVPLRNITQLFDSDTLTSEQVVARANTVPRNMMDGRSGTYWIQSAVATATRTKMTTKLIFDLAGVKTINYVELEPANVYPFKLTKIYYYDNTNRVILLQEPNLTISTFTTHIFPTVTTGRLILEFEAVTKRRVNFIVGSAKPLSEQAASQPVLGAPRSTAVFGPDLSKLQVPLTVAQRLGLGNRNNVSFFGYSFDIGFDNVRFGKGDYSAKSIYVSKAIELKDPSQVGLKVIEKRPAGDAITSSASMTESTYDAEDSVFYHGSIEYWVAKRDFDSAGNIVATTKVPILPTGTTRVNHERLVLTERSGTNKFLPDIGALMFFADAETSDIVLYRNGTQMSSTEWEAVSTVDDLTPDTGRKMKFKIKIKSILAGDIITVTYTPVLSSTIAIPPSISQYSTSGLAVVDLVGDLSARVVQDQLLIFTKGDNADKIDKSLIYLVIVLRNNTGDTALTPAVEEYMLVVGDRDLQKFSGDAF